MARVTGTRTYSTSEGRVAKWTARREARATGGSAKDVSTGEQRGAVIITHKDETGRPVVTKVISKEGRDITSQVRVTDIKKGKIVSRKVTGEPSKKVKEFYERKAEAEKKRLGKITPEQKKEIYQQVMKDYKIYTAPHPITKKEMIIGVQDPFIGMSMAVPQTTRVAQIYSTAEDYGIKGREAIRPTEKVITEGGGVEPSYAKRYEEVPKYTSRPIDKYIIKTIVGYEKGKERVLKGMKKAEEEPSKLTFWTVPVATKKAFKVWDESIFIRPWASRGYEYSKKLIEFQEKLAGKYSSEGKRIRSGLVYATTIPTEFAELGFKYPTASLLTLGLGSTYKIIGKGLEKGLKWGGRYGVYQYGKQYYKKEITIEEAIGKGLTLKSLTGAGKRAKWSKKVTGRYKSEVHPYRKGEKIPYMSRMEQVKLLTSGEKVIGTTGLRYGELLIKKIGVKKIRDPAKLGDVPAGIKGFFVSPASKYMKPVGSFFLESKIIPLRMVETYKGIRAGGVGKLKAIPKTIIKTPYFSPKIIYSKYRTVELPKGLRQKLLTAVEYGDKPTLKILQKEVYSKAYKQSLKYKEPILVPSPKRFAGELQPEREAFAIIAGKVAGRVTGKKFRGVTEGVRKDIKIYEIAFGKQPKLKRGYRFENILYNINKKQQQLLHQHTEASRKLGELYGGLRMAKGEYGGHGRLHLEDVTSKMLGLKRKYPKTFEGITTKEIKLAGKYHDIVKVWEIETQPFKHAEASSKMIRKGLFKEFEGLTTKQRKRIARAIELHTKVQPTIISKVIYRPQKLARALATADREALRRFGTVVDPKQLFVFKEPRDKLLPKDFFPIGKRGRVALVPSIEKPYKPYKPKRFKEEELLKSYKPKKERRKYPYYKIPTKKYIPAPIKYEPYEPYKPYKPYKIAPFYEPYKPYKPSKIIPYKPHKPSKYKPYKPYKPSKYKPYKPYKPSKYKPYKPYKPKIPPPPFLFKIDRVTKKKKKYHKKPYTERYYTPGFTGRVLGLHKKLTTKQAKKLLKTELTGAEVRPWIILPKQRVQKIMKPVSLIKKPRKVKIKKKRKDKWDIFK